MSSNARSLIGGAAILIAGIAIGRLGAPSAREVVPVPVAAVPRGGDGRCVARVSDDDLRRVRDTVTASAPAPAAPAREPEAAAPAPDPTATQLAADAEVSRTLDGAFAAGQWTDRDADALRRALPRMDPDARIDALQRFSAAIDAGRLTLATSGLPL